MPSDWLTAEQFLKQAASSSVGLPKKVINVDTDKQPSKVNQTGGMLYEAELHSDAVNAAPKLLCPCCGQPASDIAGAKQLYQIDVKETMGKSHKGDVPPCPVSGLDLPTMVYSVEPCGCRVSAEWAGSFSAELQSRIAGNKPRAVVDMTAKQREQKLAHLEGKLAELFVLQTVCQAAAPTVQKEAVDYWIVIVADQMQRLVPSPLNMKPSTTPLSPKVEKWAKDGGFATPPTPEPAKPVFGWGHAGWPSAHNFFDLPDATKPKQFVVGQVSPPPPATGQYVYRMKDGSVSTVPAYDGQQPCGQVAANPYAKVKITADKEEGSWGQLGQAAVALVQAGVLDPKTLLDTWGPKENLAKAAASTGYEEIEISQTKNHQWSVRRGDVYKVFINKLLADEFAQQFAQQLAQKYAHQGWASAKPKPVLQPLPVEDQTVNVVGGTPEEKAAYISQLKNVLKATHPSEMPKALLERIYHYSWQTEHQHLALSVLQTSFGEPLKSFELLKLYQQTLDDLKGYIDGKQTSLSSQTVKYVKTFVDLVDIPPPPKVQQMAQPSAAVPTNTAGMTPTLPAEEVFVIDRSVRKKRTIRKIVD